MEPTIIIDAGHGGYDNGASYNGRREKDDNLRLALAVGSRLEQDGFPVVYTRTTDVYQKPIEKARIGNASGGDYFVSFHRNASPNANTYSGVQTLVYNDSGIAGELARNVNEEMTTVGFNDLGIPVRKDLVVLRRTSMPSILIEAGFLNTDADNQTFDENFDALADAIARGIEKTVGTGSGSSGTGNSSGTGAKQFGVQVGLFRRYENAQYALNELLDKGYNGEIRTWNEYYAVVAGPVENIEAARTLERQLSQAGYDTLVVNF